MQLSWCTVLIEGSILIQFRGKDVYILSGVTPKSDCSTIINFAYILTKFPSLSMVGVSDRRGEKWHTQLSMDMHVGNAIPILI